MKEWTKFKDELPPVGDTVLAYAGEPYIEDHVTVIQMGGNGYVLNLETDMFDTLHQYYLWKSLPEVTEKMKEMARS